MNAVAEQFLDSETLSVSKTLLIGVAGTTGSGKTETAMRLATGIAGPGNFSVIDSENKRALNKKSRYRFAHLDMRPPYSPEHYRELIEKSVKAGHRAVVIDSFSAEWDDEGGLQDDAAAILERMSKGDAGRAERLTALAWKEPKQRHRSLMRFLRKLEIPIIFCLRAEPKIKFTKDERGKTQVVDAGWLPIAEKLFGYDMLVYCLMMPENPGVPVHLKKLEQEFEPMFPMGKQVTENAGKMLAAWASGKTESPRPQSAAPATASEDSLPSSPPSAALGDPFITPDEQLEISDECRKLGNCLPLLLKAASKATGTEIGSIAKMPATSLEDCRAWLVARKERAAEPRPRAEG